MRIVVFSTHKEKASGLQHMSPIEDETLFLFPNPFPGSFFHSVNVREPFDLAFLDRTGGVLSISGMRPPLAVARVPVGAAIAVEARLGLLGELGWRLGRQTGIDPYQLP